MSWTRLLPLLLAAPAFGQYAYYFSDTFSSINTTNWYQNGSISGGSSGLTGTGGSVISKVAVSGPSTTNYEVKTTYNLSTTGAVYETYLRATSNADINGTVTGTFYAVQLTPTFTGSTCNATLVVYKSISGSPTSLLSQPVACNNQMTMRAVIVGAYIIIYLNNYYAASVNDTAIASGQPGVGVLNVPAGNGIARVDLGPYDNVAPNPVNTQTLGTSVFPNHVDIQWQGASDNPTGSGVAYYQVARNGTLLASISYPIYTDATVAASTSYTYTIQVVDFHWNVANVNINITTPPAGAIDPREIGVRPTGTYWGYGGEQMDMRTGNLNYTLPLVKAMGRGGWGVGFNLTYNSRNWRQDQGGIWNLGRDVGYGYGWQLQAGSLTPVFVGYFALDHWAFTDATGAEYRLDQNSGGVWSSKEGIYLYFDSSTGRLYFQDGSFWVFGCVSAGTEEDAGTFYPTLMEDSNGNEITVSYNIGSGVTWANSSARPSTINDVRTNGSFTFTYSGTTPHLSTITNNVGTAENYTTSITTGQALKDPFAQTSFGTTAFLQSITQTGTSLTTGFTYDPSGSGELDQMTTPYGGHLRWAYSSFTYTSTPDNRTQREVQTRYTLTNPIILNPDGATPAYVTNSTESTYQISRDATANPFHSWAQIDDPDGKSEKAWYFQTNSAQSGFGSLSELEWRPVQNLYSSTTYPTAHCNTAPNSSLSHCEDYTWTTDPTTGNPYVSAVLTTEDEGSTPAVQKKTTQQQDQYGNVTQVQMFDYGNLSAPARTQTNGYLNNSNYTSRYIYNRLVSSTVTDGTNTATPVQNTYDVGALTNQSSITMHDSLYGTSFTYRGNVTGITTLTHSVSIAYDIGGNVVQATDNGVTTSTTINSSTYYAAPSSLTTNSLSTSLNFTAFLSPSSQTGPNGDVASISYDSNARPSTTTSPYGAVTTFTYNDTATPPTRLAITAGSTGNHGNRTTLDGFGRPIRIETGTSTAGVFTAVSAVDTQYTPCGCTPIGKLKQSSQPYAPSPSAAPVYTSYTYDGLGRTLTKQLPDGSTTRYYYGYPYLANTVTVFDPAGKWKQFTQDAFGNLTTVVEPMPGISPMPAPPSTSPSNPYDSTKHLKTQYTYDVLNHLTGVPMLSNSTAQTRSFNYTNGTTVGALLLSARNPENGTVTYTYNTNHTLATKTDAKNQQTQYSYDSYNRVTQVRHYPVNGGAEDTTQQVNYSYDTNPYDTGHTFSSNTAGRLAAVSYAATVTASGAPAGPQLQEWYSYHQAGAQTKKRVHINVGTGANLDATYTYDNEGKMTSVAYPNSGPTFTYSFDSMSRPTGLTDQNSVSRVSGVSYGPSSELLGITFFSAAETRSYNSLVQLTGIVDSGAVSANIQYSYPLGTNNGKINQQTDVISGEQVVYTYDSLNRLATATAADNSWGESYVYDGFGNLYQKNPTHGAAPPLSVTIDATTNRVNASGVTYDANGNMLTPGGGLTSYAYDVENRMIQSYSPATAYAYSPSNQRVWKGNYTVNNGLWTLSNQEVYFYGVDGKKLGTYVIAANPVTILTTDLRAYFGSKQIAYASSSTGVTLSNLAPFIADRLGSSRFDEGTHTKISLYPYGEDKGTPGTNDEVKFATYTRDSATGLDYAMNRYYSNSLGRFTSPDSGIGAHPQDPQSWNRYAYGGSDPVNHNDPSGRDFCGADDLFCFIESTDPGLGEMLNVDFSAIAALIAAEVQNSLVVSQKTADQERQKRKAAIEAALAAIAAAQQKKSPQGQLPVWPAEIKELSMCWTTDKLTASYELDVTYEVISELGTVMTGTQLDNFSITEAFPVQTGNLGNLNDQAGTWYRGNNSLQGNGTFTDVLSSGATPSVIRFGSALQVFTATGWFGTQPLDILGFGSISGVNSNNYAPNSVTVNGQGGAGAVGQCR